MSLSKKFKSYRANGGKLRFAEWSAAYDRMAAARAARGQNRTVSKATKAAVVESVTPTFERVSKRVDCMGTSKKGVIFVGADKADAKKVARILGAKTVRSYTSKRGERVLLSTRTLDLSGLEAAGFTPKGF